MMQRFVMSPAGLALDRFLVRIRRRPQPVHARILAGAERARVWEELKVDVPTYAHYGSLTQREIPVIALEPR